MERKFEVIEGGKRWQVANDKGEWVADWKKKGKVIELILWKGGRAKNW